MSQLCDLQKFGCGQNGCGNHGALCPTCEKSFMASTKTKCPDGNSRCSDKNPCDFCQGTKHSLVEKSGKEFDVDPFQLVHGSSKHSSCPNCQGPERLCQDCLEKIISSLGNDGDTSNPNVPKIRFHIHFGPKPKELYAFTNGGIENMRREMRVKFRGYLEDRDFFPDPKFQITAEVLSTLIDSGFHHIGFEGTNNNCFMIVVLIIFALNRSLIERINTHVFAGFLMRYVVEKFLRTLFVDRMLSELFRIEALALMPESMRNGFMGMSCPNDFFFQIENCEILNRGPYLSPPVDSEGSRMSASCVVLEKSKPTKDKMMTNVDGKRFDVLPNAISHAVGETPLSGILLFQFKEGFDYRGRAVPQGAGAMDFPTKNLSVNKKKLSLIAFTRIQRSHYQIVVRSDRGEFFNFNSVSPANEGHTLPILSRMTEPEAHSIFKTEAHTCVFRCLDK